MPSELMEGLDESLEIGLTLCREAIVWRGECTWLANQHTYENGRWTESVTPLAPDLYGGISGVMYFLAALYGQTEVASFKRIAVAACRACASLIENSTPLGLGYYTGLSGVVHAIQQAAITLKSSEAKEIANRLFSKHFAAERILATDVISGMAGVIPFLLSMADGKASKHALAAKLLGQRLINEAQPSIRGISWATMPGTRSNLTGYSHGASGIAVALLELGKFFDDQRFTNAAYEGFQYERNTFNKTWGNWPDFRQPSTSLGSFIPCSCFWCHGAPGIALARLRACQLRPDKSLLLEAKVGVSTTIKNLVDHFDYTEASDSLCHGFAGNLDCVLVYSRLVASPDHERWVRRFASDLLRLKRQRGKWRSGLRNRKSSPSLLLGDAGIGYFYLRLYCQDIPSVLLPWIEQKPLT